jgi:hypothetical protein
MVRNNSIMSFEDYLTHLPRGKRLSKVKVLILRTLWENGDAFPKQWVSSDKLLHLTGQKYFDRRLRELRDQSGCDVESSYVDGGHAWRLCSSEIHEIQDREYLNAEQKTALFKKYDCACAVCGAKVKPGLRGLQADHKVPLSRNGSNTPENWQPLCNVCNVGKRRACAGCTLDCQECPWAFPERVGVRTMLSINEKTLRKVDQFATDNQLTQDKVFEDAADYYIDEKTKRTS